MLKKFILYISIILTAVSAQADTLADVLKKLGTVDTYQADFVQFTEIEGFGEDQYSGRLYIKKGENAFWDYSKPYRQFYLFDDKNMKYFDSETKQLIVQALSPETNVFMRLMLKPADIENDFQLTLDRGELLLHPKTESGISDIIFTIENGIISGIRTTDQSGNKTRILMKNIITGKPLPAKIFQPEIPAGTEVFEFK
jgi:outer membrane lipoprotein carrier protein